MSWWSYVEGLAQGAPQSRIAQWAGVSAPTVTRWAQGAGVDPQPAARLARACGRPVLEAFIAAGFLTEEEANARPALPRPLSEVPASELAAEVTRRLTDEVHASTTPGGGMVVFGQIGAEFSDGGTTRPVTRVGVP